MPDWSEIRGLLFDKDGTLIDIEATWVPAYCSIAEGLAGRIGRPDMAEGLLRRAGYDRARNLLEADSVLAAGTNRELIDLWGAMLGDSRPTDMEAWLQKAIAGARASEPVAAGDLPSLFELLRARGFALGVATNDDTAAAQQTVERLGLGGYLAFVCGADAGHGGKPGPGMGLAFCRSVGIAPHRAAMIGDSALDALMARGAGFGATVGVCTGAASAGELEAWFDVVVESVADLPRLLRLPQAGA